MVENIFLEYQFVFNVQLEYGQGELFIYSLRVFVVKEVQLYE